MGLDFNTSKSSFAYFHDADAPLMRSIRTTLTEHNIEVRTDWVTVVGAVIGRDADAISAGVAATQAVDQSSAAFFRRLQLEPLNVQSAMIVLRQCGVPQMNYSLRCMPPSCIAQQAAAFDDLVIGAAQSKLLLHADEMCKAETLERLRAPLRHGGFGLTSALSTSPAAFLGSMAAVAAGGAPVFLPHSQPDCPLPSTSLLYGWLEDSMQKVRVHQLAPQLPATAASFFQHFPPRLPSSRDLSAFVLQRELSSQATSNTYKASLQRTKELEKTDGGRALAHLVAVSAPRAWAWKSVAPTSKELELTDTQYRLAARLNLDLQPMEGAAALSDDCSLCGRSNAIRNDPWHYLSCKKLSRGEITVRHDDVGRTLHRNALTLGLKAQLEPKGLQADSNLRPDLLISLPGRTILTDVAVCHPLAPGAVKRRGGKLAKARTAEQQKKRKYAKLASQRRYEMLPFAVETSGGFAPAAVQLMHAMALAAAQTFLLWSHTVSSCANATTASCHATTTCSWTSLHTLPHRHHPRPRLPLQLLRLPPLHRRGSPRLLRVILSVATRMATTMLVRSSSPRRLTSATPTSERRGRLSTSSDTASCRGQRACCTPPQPWRTYNKHRCRLQSRPCTPLSHPPLSSLPCRTTHLSRSWRTTTS